MSYRVHKLFVLSPYNKESKHLLYDFHIQQVRAVVEVHVRANFH